MAHLALESSVAPYGMTKVHFGDFTLSFSRPLQFEHTRGAPMRGVRR
jgi:hypothetical protein